MAKAAKDKKDKKLQATLISDAAFPDSERISIPFSLEDVGKLKIGQEISVTIKGCVNRLEGDKFYSSIGMDIYEKSFRRTSNTQAEGLRKLSDEEDEY